jgi:hypothetical protein
MNECRMNVSIVQKRKEMQKEWHLGTKPFKKNVQTQSDVQSVQHQQGYRYKVPNNKVPNHKMPNH